MSSPDLQQLLDKARNERIWGTVEISFADGCVVALKLNQTFKISSTGGKTDVGSNSGR